MLPALPTGTNTIGNVGPVAVATGGASQTHLVSAATTNATDNITATSTASGATVLIKNGSTTVASGSPATWSAGVNHVKITVKLLVLIAIVVIALVNRKHERLAGAAR